MANCARCFGELPDLAVFCPGCGQPHEPDFDCLLNATVGGRYRIYRRLGQGGLSTVFVAIDTQTDRVVVVKVSDPRQLVRRDLTYSIDGEAARAYWAEMLERMRREAETLAAINHPNIVGFRDTGAITDELRYVVMEFLRGTTLRETLDANKRLPLEVALQIALDCCAALREVHARGIVHRDLNPRNVMLCAAAEVAKPSAIDIKVIDFGIAKCPQPPGAPPFTQHSVMSGTVAYASPEQCQNQPLDQRADIYSLGVMLFELVTGQRPFNGRTPTEVALRQIQSEPPPPRALNPDLPVSLETTILRTLAKDPAQRHAHIDQLAEELRAIARRIVVPLPVNQPKPEPVIIAPVPPLRLVDEDEPVMELNPPPALATKQPQRRKALAVAAVVLVLAAAGLLFGRNGANGRRAQDSIASALPAATVKAGAAPSSQADALELAAQLPGAAAGGGVQVATPVTQKSAPVPAMGERKKVPAGYDKPAAPSPTVPTPVRQPNSPVPAPAIAAAREPQPPPQPDIAQGPRRPSASATETTMEPRADATASPPRPDDTNPAVRPTRPRRRGESHPAPRPADDDADDDGDDDDDDNERNANRLGPKVIAWSGYVNRERTITIELPGVPGTVEVPRGYDRRVGVVEPPGPDNRWRCAVLRVFGRGEMSVIVRWWPKLRQVARRDD